MKRLRIRNSFMSEKGEPGSGRARRTEGSREAGVALIHALGNGLLVKLIRDREDAVQRTTIADHRGPASVIDAFQLGFAEAKKNDEAAQFVEGFSMAMSLLESHDRIRLAVIGRRARTSMPNSRSHWL